MRPEVTQLLDELAKQPAELPPLADTLHVVRVNAPEALTIAADRALLCKRLADIYGASLDEVRAAAERPSRQKLQSTYRDDFRPLAPTSGWLGDYLRHSEGVEPPTAFHFFAALACLGAALRRQVYVDQKRFRIFPNVSVLLAGPSGVKKTTATDMAIVDLGVRSGRVRIIAERITEEKLYTKLTDLSAKEGEAVGCLYAPELSTFLGKKDYQKGTIEALTRVLDVDIDQLIVETQSRGTEVVKHPAITFVGCSNERWLSQSIPAHAFEGGFPARVIMVWQGGTDRIFPVPLAPDEALQERLLRGLVKTAFVGTSSGVAVALSPPAQALYHDLYMDMKSSVPGDDRLVPFYNRLDGHLLRVALLLAVSEAIYDINESEGWAPAIEHGHIETAANILDWTIRKLPRVYDYIGGTAMGEIHDRILRLVWQGGGELAEPELVARMASRLSRDRLFEALRTLEAAEWLRATERPFMGRQRRFWQLLRDLED